MVQEMEVTRRKFLKQSISTGTAIGLSGFLNTVGGCKKMSAINKKKFKRCLILGMDGLNPKVLRKLMAAGKLPNFSRLANSGTFKNLPDQ